MTIAIIYTSNDNNKVHVCTPSGEFPLEYVIANDIPSGVEYFIVDTDTFPKQYDQLFDAWEQHNGVISVNLEKAKEVTKFRLRFERIEPLRELDVAFQRALETGADTTAIVAEKQRLRDLPLLADTCQTPDELLALKAVL